MKNSSAAPTPFSLWVPVLMYAALVFTLSCFSFHTPWFENTQKNHADKLVHVVEYSVFGVLLCRALGAQGFFKRSPGRLFLAVVLSGFLYGVSDEFHQRFVPYRDSSPYDVMADTVGAALGSWAWLRKVLRENA